ncbi:hypothetical protein FYL80_25210, partial [Salmonella enterica subsp. enterica serovar Typhimurium]
TKRRRAAAAGVDKREAITPPVQRRLDAIENNLRQTERKVSRGLGSLMERVHVVAAMKAIEGGWRQVRQDAREQGGRDDS